jgi:general secretion pathway protein L
MSELAALSPALDRAAALYRWWGAELAGMLPAGLRQALLAPPPLLLALPAEDGFRFARLHRGAATPLARPQPALPCWLVLPAEAMLVKRLDWPLLPDGDLQRSLALDLDRQMPFPAEALRMAVRVVARDEAARRQTIDLAVVPEARLAPLLATLRRHHGLVPEQVVGGGPAEAPDRFRFAPAAAATPQGLAGLLPRQRRTWLLLACLVLAVANLSLWQAAEESRLEALDQAVREARIRAGSADSLRRQLAERRAFMDQLTGRTREASVARVMEELSRLLPDSAFVESLELRGEVVHLVGQAAAAAALVGVIEASPLFQDVQFRAPLVPDRGSGRERFELAITLRRPT